MRVANLRAHLLFVVIILGVISLIWLAILQPLATWRAETASRLKDTRAESLRIQQSLLSLTQERNSLALGGTEGLVWAAPQLGEATALVQARVSELAKKNGLSLRSITPLSKRDSVSANSVGFRLELEAPLDRLTAFLVDLEYNSPALAVEQSDIRRLIRPGPDQGQPALFVQLDILAPVVLADGGAKL